MSPIEHRRLPPHARQVASCSGFSKVHLEQIVFKGEDCALLFYLRHDHMLKAAGSSSCCFLTRIAPTLLLLVIVPLSGDSNLLGALLVDSGDSPLLVLVVFSSFFFSFFEFLLLSSALLSSSSILLLLSSSRSKVIEALLSLLLLSGLQSLHLSESTLNCRVVLSFLQILTDYLPTIESITSFPTIPNIPNLSVAGYLALKDTRVGQGCLKLGESRPNIVYPPCDCFRF